MKWTPKRRERRDKGRLPRPYVSRDVRLRVVMRQLGVFAEVIERTIEQARGPGNWGRLLGIYLRDLADQIGCKVEDLRLDHDPALVNRRKVMRLGAFVDYDPPANDPASLIYRAAPDHDIKTRVRGDGAQLSDLGLMRKFRRIEKRKREGKRGRFG